MYNVVTAMKKIVSVKNLTKIFVKKSLLYPFLGKKRSFTAVNNISFDINKGEIVGLLGPNGAGKTTTIQMLLGLITPTSGTIGIFGKNFENHRAEILSKLNFSSTYTHLPWRLTVWENLNVIGHLYGIPDRKEKIFKVLRMLNMFNKKDKEVGDLSSGWTTRLNLARTFLNDPEFVLLDEPTSSLDPESAGEIRKNILKIKKERGTTVLWTSHNMAEVEEVCDRGIFLNHGKIIDKDTPDGLAKRIRNVRVSLLLKDKTGSLFKLVKENNWQIKSQGRFTVVELQEIGIPKLLNSMAVKKISYSEISIDKPTLEDYFLSQAKVKEDQDAKN